MKKREFVSKIMSTELKTINHTNTLQDVKNIFDEKKVRHIPVVSGDKLLGIVSLTDFMRITWNMGEAKDAVNNAIYHTTTVEDIMTKDVVSVNSQDTIKEVAEILAEKEFHALPVVDNGKLAGLVTTTDIIKYLLEQY